MALFQFTALRQGEKISGEREGADKQAIVAALKAEGVVALSVELAGRGGARSHGSAGKSILTLSIFSRVPSTEKIIFARNLSSMVGAGLPLSRALAVLEKQTKNAAMKTTLHQVGEDVKQGTMLGSAFAHMPKVFSPLFIAMTRAGEESGTLAASLQLVATQMEKSYALTKKIRGAMIYPAIVITVMFAIGVLMLIYVVPTLAQTFASLNTTLPLPTRIILSVSSTLTHHVLLIGSLVIAFFFLFGWAKGTLIGKQLFDRGVLMLPVIGVIVAKVNAARTARTLSSLLGARIGALTALEITGSVVQNSRFRPVIARAQSLVEKGKPLSEAFIEAEGIYPVMFSEMAAVGEETGDLPGMLERVADFYESEVEQETKDLSTIIEPVLMVIIGAGVGFFAVAMIMPIYSLSSSL